MSNEVLTWWRGKPFTNEVELNDILHEFGPLFLYDMCCADNREMSVSTIHSILNDDVLRDEEIFPLEVLKIIHVSQALDYLNYCVGERIQISCGLIRTVHGFAMSGLGGVDGGWKASTSGEFRKGEVADIEYAVKEIIRKFYTECDEDELVAALCLYARLAILKPFDKGNRTVNNLLLNYCLMLNGYPPVSIAAGSKDAMDTAITLFKVTGETDPLSVAMNSVVIHSWIDYVLH